MVKDTGPEGAEQLPRRFSFISSQTSEAITSPTWEDLFPTGNSDGIFQTSNKSQSDTLHPTWWLDIQDATDREIALVSQALSIHPLTAEDIAIREPREKVEVFRNYYLISFQTLLSHSKDETRRHGIPPSAEMYILVFQHCVVTFSPSRGSHVIRVRERIRKLHDPSILSSGWICYALVDDIVDSFEPFTRAAERESSAIEDQVFIARIDDVKALIPRVDELRKKITHIMRCLHGKVDVLNSLVKRCQVTDKHAAFPDAEMLLYLGDVQDHLVTTMSMLLHIDEIISRSQANCLAQLSVTSLRVSYKINSVLSKVTVLATIFVPCHLVTGMFGMNVEVPGQDVEGLSWFFGIVGAFVAFFIICMGVAAKFRLL